MDLDTFTIFITVSVVGAIAAWVKFVKTGPVCKSSTLLTGRTVLITGGSAGIGMATAIELAKRKARIIIACRNEEKGTKVLEEIKRESGSCLVHLMKLNLSDFDSIKEFVKDFTQTEARLDILINNAAAFGVGVTTQRHDLMFGTNQLGPFLLTNLLMPIMKKQAEWRPVRIVNVCSEAYKFGKVDLKNLNPFGSVIPNPMQVFVQYANTKLMNVYFTTELNKQLRKDNPGSNAITTYAVHPGTIGSRLGADYADSSVLLRLIRPCFIFITSRSIFYGCQTTLHCCLSEGIEEDSGKYFSNCAKEKLLPHATDPELGRALWEKCVELTGLDS